MVTNTNRLSAVVCLGVERLSWLKTFKTCVVTKQIVEELKRIERGQCHRTFSHPQNYQKVFWQVLGGVSEKYMFF